MPRDSSPVVAETPAGALAPTSGAGRVLALPIAPRPPPRKGLAMSRPNSRSRFALAALLLVVGTSCAATYRNEPPPWTDKSWLTARVTCADGSRVVLSSARVEQHGASSVVVGTRERTKHQRESIPLERVTRIESKIRPSDADAPPADKLLNAFGVVLMPALVIVGIAAVL